MRHALPSYRSRITRGLAVVALVNILSMVVILWMLRPVMIGSLTDEYLEKLGSFINEDIRYVLLVRDPVTTQDYMNSLIDFPWVSSAQLFEQGTLLVEAGGPHSWQAPVESYTRQGGVRVIGDQVHLTRLIDLDNGSQAPESSVQLHITIIDQSLSGAIDRILYLLLGSVGILSAGLFAVSLYFARRATRVVTQLSEGMQMVDPERGELSPITLSTDIKEFDAVQRSFNALVKRVDEYNDELESRIRDRTQALATALELKEHADAVKSSLIMNLSHDLKTPLTANIGYLDVALEELDHDAIDTGKLRHAIQGARARGRLLSHEVNTLLDYSVSADDLIHIVHQDTNVRALLDDALTATEMQRKASRNSLEYSYTGNDYLHTAERLVRHVLDNLLSNANRYCSDGVVEVNCHVDSALHLTVSDTGPGIPNDEREHIFEPHFRSAVNNSVGPKGMGIGLAMIKNWVDHLNGSITLQPRSDKTVFSVTIPCSRD